MHRAFNLSLNDRFTNFYARGEELNAIHRFTIKNTLDSFIAGPETIDGSRLQECWFPQVKADVFISHSHADKDLATELAGWLSTTFNIVPFIDSCVWGYADELLKTIDDKHCLNPARDTYNYEKRNGSTSHVHMMLTTALGMMMDNTECLMFLNTPNSICTRETISKTRSPWLYMELAMARIVRRKTPGVHRDKIRFLEYFSNKQAEARLNIEYQLSLDAFTPINRNTLAMWDAQHKGKDTHALDTLYEIAQ